MTTDPRSLLREGLGHHQAGRFAEAQRCYQQVLNLRPDDADALHLMGVLLQQTHQPQAGIAYLSEAVRLAPHTVQFLEDLGQALQSQNRLEEAIAVYERLLSIAPEHDPALRRLGVLQLQQRRLPIAISLLSKCLELVPGDAVARENLAIALLLDKQNSAAQAHFQRLIESGGAVASTHYHLAVALLRQGQFEQALLQLQVVLQQEPGHLDAWNMIGHCLSSLRRPEDALAALRKGLEIRPSDPALHCTLASVLLGNHEIDEALDHCRKAIAHAPEFAFGHLTLARALLDQGLQDEAIESYRRAAELQPDLSPAETGYLIALYYSPSWDHERILQEILRWSSVFAAPLYPPKPVFENDRDPHRPLRVGFVSADLRNNPVGRFLAHLFQEIDRTTIRVICFSAVVAGDELTSRFEEVADEWHSVGALSDAELAETIRAGKIDLLVDLALFTAQQRLLTFARRPAPIQLTYLAYPGTSGLATVDYRISDPYIDPPGSERFYREQTLRVPSYWCYEAPADAPEVSALATQSNGFVTFGSLNRFAKVTPWMLQKWLEILKSVADSRLLLLCDSDTRFRQIRLDFASHIDPTRLEQIRSMSMSDYFRLYHRIDIALDPHPFGGGTTTCDALYMGVPVVTLAGRNGVSRGSVSVLSQVGLTSLIADSPQQYIEIASALANDLPRLGLLRSTLRQRMRASPLMDAPAFVSHLQDSFRSIWMKWCQSSD